MPIDFDPVFHTETMVKILREQGSTQYATELAELILKNNPQHEGVRRILEELREEARRAFERFKSGGRAAETPHGSDLGETTASASELEVKASTEAELALVDEAEAVSVPPVSLPAEPVEGSEEFLSADLAASEAEEKPPQEGLDPAVPTLEAGGLEVEPVRLTLVPPPPPPTWREVKILRLQSLLRRVQSLRKASHAPQT